MFVRMFVLLSLVLSLLVAPTMACAPEAQQIELTYASSVDATNTQGFAGTAGPWMDAVQQRLEGRVTFDVVLGGALLGWDEMMDGIGSGIADIGYTGASIKPTECPSWQMSGLVGPAVGNVPAYENVLASEVMCSEFSNLTEELEAANLTLLFLTSTEPMVIGVTKDVKRLADMEGVKIRVQLGKYQAMLFESVGAVPMTVAWTDLYDSLQKGVVDAFETIPTGIRDGRFYEVVPNLVGPSLIAPLSATYMIVMNKDTFEGLPADVRAIMLEEAKRVETEYAQEVGILRQEALDEMEAAGTNIYDFPAEDVATWEEIEQDVLWDAYLTESEPMGVPASEMLARWVELINTPTSQLEQLYDKAWEDRIDQAS